MDLYNERAGKNGPLLSPAQQIAPKSDRLPSFRLPVRHVTHTVGPVWQGGQAHEADLLASCYRQSLRLAEQVGAASLAFACISTGVYGFPKDAAAQSAVQTVRQLQATSLREVIFCCFQPMTCGVTKPC